MKTLKAKNVQVRTMMGVLTLMLAFCIFLPSSLPTSVLGAEPGVPGPTEIPNYNGTIVIAIVSEPPHLNPGLTTNVAMTVVTSEIFSGLTYVGRDWQAFPLLAEYYNSSADGLTWMFKLRENANWTDGVPVTSADVVYSWYNVLSLYHTRAKYTWQFIDKIKAIGPYGVLFTLKNPVAYFPILMNGYFAPVLPKHIFEGTNVTTNPYGTGEKMPVGCGPYIMTEWAKGDHLTLVKNPNYWWTDPIRGYQLPYLDKIIYKVIPSMPTAYLALQNKEVDYLTTDAVSLSDMVTIKQEGKYYYLPKSGPLDQTQLILNLRHAPLNNTLVRQALDYATDKQYIVDHGYWGQGTVLTGPFGPGNFGYTTDTKQYPFNLTKANELLDQAGYPKDPATGIRFTLSRGFPYNTATTSFVSIFEIVRDNWKKVGVEIVGKPGDQASMMAMRTDPEGWDVAVQEKSTYPDPSPGLSPCYTSWSVGMTPGAGNDGAYNNTQDDALWLAAAIELNVTKRAEIFVEIQRLLAEDVPRIWLYEAETNTVWSKDFVNACQTFSPGANLQVQLIWWTKGTAPPTPGLTVPKAQYDALNTNYTKLKTDYDALSAAGTGVPIWIWGALVVLIAIVAVESFIIVRPKKKK